MNGASPDYSLESIVGASSQIRDLRLALGQAAEASDTPLLLIGEHGTGKRLAARVVHFNSSRRSRPLVEMTCAGVAEHLLGSALFGHERGAFPDAREQRTGALERVEGGTVLIDEIDHLSPSLQDKLFQVIDTGRFTRLGGQDVIHSSVRIVGASVQLPDGIAREIPSVVLAPLRARAGDVPLLGHHYVGLFNSELRRDVRGFTAEALSMLATHWWPGNVRELRNTIERAMLVLEGDRIRPVDLAVISTHGGALFRLPADGVALEDVERQLLVQALERARGNQTQAGRLLGLKRDQIRYRMAKFGLETEVTWPIMR